ncbi:MAG: nuclear transport factor 2 family protein [Saprospiraceae bacterium]|nr:nuclear transport factor 2 family protein [Saprospiraceae bacterium]
MKTFFLTTMVVVFSLFFSSTIISQTQPAYKDMIGENPNADADIKIVGDFVKSLVSGDLDKAKSLMDPNYIGRGPSRIDSANVEKTLTNWQANYKTQTDRKVTFVTQTHKVLSGVFKGEWVSLWGNYTFTQAGKTITFPFQLTSRVADGKIMSSIIYFDNLYVATQLGFKLTPSESTTK